MDAVTYYFPIDWAIRNCNPSCICIIITKCTEPFRFLRRVCETGCRACSCVKHWAQVMAIAVGDLLVAALTTAIRHLMPTNKSYHFVSRGPAILTHPWVWCGRILRRLHTVWLESTAIPPHLHHPDGGHKQRVLDLARNHTPLGPFLQQTLLVKFSCAIEAE